jgi:glycosyltransferase involved in cell wall biosynthesis
MIVHTHSSKAGIIGRCAARFARVPVVVHSIHGFGFTPDQHPLTKRLLIAFERWAARLTSRFLAVSQANRRLGISLEIFPAERCSVVRSGVDLNAIRQTHVNVSAKRRELGLKPDGAIVGMIAPLKPQKAPMDFVRVAALVHRRKLDTQFVLIGDGELRQAVRNEVDRCGLSATFHLLGWRRDIAEVLRCMSVFVLTSRWEGLPRVYLEALASGVPVVGTRVDGAQEVIREGVNGYLCEPGDVKELAGRVVFLLDHPDDMKRMGRCAATIPSEFDIYEMVRQQQREYERLVAEWRQRLLINGSRHTEGLSFLSRRPRGRPTA